jgi:prepilin-type N-terminal cleavage/methylation domain-containing protein
MFLGMQNKKYSNGIGFTLVEVLVVIAIIGILSSVAVVNLNSARDKARVAAVTGLFDEINTAVLLCINDDKQILCTDSGFPGSYCGNDADVPAPGIAIFAGSSNTWPDITTEYSDWEYADIFDSDIANQSYTIGAAMIDLSNSVTCTELGCVNAAVSTTCGNGILEGGELCDSSLAQACDENPNYYQLGYVGTGICASGTWYAGCNNTCDACVLSNACKLGGPVSPF